MQDTQVQSLGQEVSPEGGNGNPCQYSCLGNPMDRGACQAVVHGVARIGYKIATKQQQQLFYLIHNFVLT